MTIGAKVNEAVKRRLDEIGVTGRSRVVQQMANLLARDIVKIVQEQPPRERRSSMRVSDIHRTVVRVEEGLNPKGPRYL